MERVQCFIDGFNLYHAIKALRTPHLKWVDLWGLSEAFIQPSKESLTDVFYFTAHATWLPAALKRHRQYIKALDHVGVKTILGHFKEKQVSCKNCGATWVSREEKGTDTNVVIQLLQEAHQDNFDTALIVSSDSDMCPAVQMVLDTFPDKKVKVLIPPHRYNIAREVRGIVTTQKIKQKHLNNNLLPQYLYDENGDVVVTRPTAYDPPNL